MSFEDVAQDIELREWERNNLRHSGKPTKFEPDQPGYGPAECEECGDDMPAERRAWGYKVCVFCKQATERAAGRR